MDYKEDLRIIRTRKLLSSTLLDMMEEQSLEKISVIDLCTKALVNRATFYAHFEDKYHLLTFALEELKDEVYARFSKDVKASSPKEVLVKLAHLTFDFVKDNRNHVANLLAHNRNGSALYRLCDKVVAIDCRTRNGKEAAPLGHGAGVVGQPCDLDLVTARQCGVCNAS